MIPTVMNPMGISVYERRLQYIASTGTQYIDTGIAPDFAGGDKIEANFVKGILNPTTASSIGFFGSRQLPALNGFYATGTSIVYCDNVSFNVISFAETGTFILTADDTDIQFGNRRITMERRVTCTYSIYLFALNNGGTPFGYCPDMKLYKWKYWRNGTLAQHLVPVLDRSGVPCLYDTVSRSLKYNAGTGTFDYA